MNFIRRFTVPLALLALTAGASAADPTSPAGSVPPIASRLGLPAEFATIVPAANSAWNYGSGPRNDAIRYRPRSYRSRSAVSESPIQLHAGFFDPDGSGSGSFVLGLRGGPLVDPHVQIGGGVDWVHRSEDRTVVAGTPYVQGNTTVTPQRVLSRASSDLVPIQLFMQVSGDENMAVIPYGGVSAGYELMFLSADDFSTNTSFNATFGGWGWQAWLGAGLPLSGQARFTGELFVNQSDPERDVTAANGATYREQVNGDGVGMRFGLQWGF